MIYVICNFSKCVKKYPGGDGGHWQNEPQVKADSISLTYRPAGFGQGVITSNAIMSTITAAIMTQSHPKTT